MTLLVSIAGWIISPTRIEFRVYAVIADAVIILDVLMFGELTRKLRMIVLERIQRARAARSGGTRLIMPPGARFRHLLAFVFGAKTSSLTFDQVIGDAQDEWLVAQCKNEHWRCRWIRVRLGIEIVMSIFALAWDKLIKNALAVSKGGK